MSTLHRTRPFVLGLAVALGGASFVALSGACSEHLPAVLGSATDASVEPISQPDAGPVTPCTVSDASTISETAHVSFEPASEVAFESPVEVAVGAGAVYVLEQAGHVQRLSADGKTASLVADVSSRIVSGGEAGLLGIAFHPRFADNHFVYLSFTAPHPTQPPPNGVVFQSVIARYESDDDGATLDLSTERRILVVDQPFSNHNGGKIAFGSDGFLYFGLGDGGSGGDPLGNGQNKDVLLGKILRLDVDTADPYGIPPTNPFAQGGGRPEIYALGFRNPWRFSFDSANGDLWVGDVGQSAREEIDKVVLGGSYGWRVREGKTCYAASTCDVTGLIDPIVDHPRAEATSIAGGVVYHGTRIPELTGKYVYGDTGTGFLFAIPTNEPGDAGVDAGANVVPLRLDTGLPKTAPTAFAIGLDGEILMTNYAGQPSIVRIAPPVAVVSPTPTETSGDVGCADASPPSQTAKASF